MVNEGKYSATMELLHKYFQIYQKNVIGAFEFHNWSSNHVLIEYCCRQCLFYCEKDCVIALYLPLHAG